MCLCLVMLVSILLFLCVWGFVCSVLIRHHRLQSVSEGLYTAQYTPELTFAFWNWDIPIYLWQSHLFIQTN